VRVAGVVLAAGGSARLGRPKQLVDVGGETLVRRSLRSVLASGCAPVALVVGADAERVATESQDLGAVLLRNDDWREGIASSIRAAAAWAESVACDGLLLALCDQPHLTSEHLAGLLAAFAREKRCVGSAYGGTIGAPAVFARSDLHALGALRGDRGAGKLLASAHATSVEWPQGAIDIDTEQDVSAHLPSRA
jgi:CTP:molybdopterin cytidylyltransferase MocA